MEHNVQAEKQNVFKQESVVLKMEAPSLAPHCPLCLLSQSQKPRQQGEFLPPLPNPSAGQSLLFPKGFTVAPLFFFLAQAALLQQRPETTHRFLTNKANILFAPRRTSCYPALTAFQHPTRKRRRSRPRQRLIKDNARSLKRRL